MEHTCFAKVMHTKCVHARRWYGKHPPALAAPSMDHARSQAVTSISLSGANTRPLETRSLLLETSPTTLQTFFQVINGPAVVTHGACWMYFDAHTPDSRGNSMQVKRDQAAV
jgi:hypothetical protein